MLVEDPFYRYHPGNVGCACVMPSDAEGIPMHISVTMPVPISSAVLVITSITAPVVTSTAAPVTINITEFVITRVPGTCTLSAMPQLLQP